jgi:phosphohistidine phosphatase
MGGNAKKIHRDARIYEAGLAPLLDVLAECPGDTRRVMLVGHNPGLEDLLIHLADGELELPEDGKLLPTATLARLRMPTDWKRLKAGAAQLISITRPTELPKQFPFPNPDSKELRDRPAYYYSQSSVIPYRLRKGKPEILIISSSKNKHWVVPKGIHDPGLSERESAAKEAEEEAGIEGKVAKAAIGSYQYPKWGATCTVRVFPMEVTRLIPEKEWEERHRGRKWVSPEQASQELRQRELHPMVLELAKALRKG